MNFRLVSIFILVALVVVFIIQNIAVVEIKYLFWSIQMSLSILMFLLIIIGIVIGWLLHSHFKNNG